ncbi:MAG: helix-turn-helix domain-containing protein [Lachnospiraceae bacterium]
MNRNETNTISKATTTAKLMRMLEASPKRFYEQYLPTVRDISFHTYLKNLIVKQKCSNADLMREAFISKTYLYQVLNGERLPGRDIVLRIAYALKLSVEETQRLLTLAGKGVLYPKIRRDAAILFCLQKKMSLDETNAFLENLGEVTLL